MKGTTIFYLKAGRIETDVLCYINSQIADSSSLLHRNFYGETIFCPLFADLTPDASLYSDVCFEGCQRRYKGIESTYISIFISEFDRVDIYLIKDFSPFVRIIFIKVDSSSKFQTSPQSYILP